MFNLSTLISFSRQLTYHISGFGFVFTCQCDDFLRVWISRIILIDPLGLLDTISEGEEA